MKSDKKIRIIQEDVVVINISSERKRIKKVFCDRPDLAKKLNELIDKVENCEWEKAMDLINSNWWQGYDRKEHCSRLEFIGCCDFDKNHTGFWERFVSYYDLIFRMKNKKTYKVFST